MCCWYLVYPFIVIWYCISQIPVDVRIRVCIFCLGHMLSITVVHNMYEHNNAWVYVMLLDIIRYTRIVKAIDLECRGRSSARVTLATAAYDLNTLLIINYCPTDMIVGFGLGNTFARLSVHRLLNHTGVYSEQ